MPHYARAACHARQHRQELPEEDDLSVSVRCASLLDPVVTLEQIVGLPLHSRKDHHLGTPNDLTGILVGARHLIARRALAREREHRRARCIIADHAGGNETAAAAVSLRLPEPYAVVRVPTPGGHKTRAR